MWIFDKDIWDEIFSTLSKNRVRTILTAIGVLWGIFLLVVLIGVANGLQNGMYRSFNDYSNSLFIWGQETAKPYKGFQRGRQIILTLEDIELLKSKVFGIDEILPRNVLGFFDGNSPVISRNNATVAANVFGDFPGILDMQKLDFKAGRFINEKDINENRKVCVISDQVVSELFKKSDNPINQYIKINNVYFQVVGFFETSQQSRGGDKTVYLPITTFSKVFNTGNKIGWIAINGNNKYSAESIKETAVEVLKKKHKVDPSDDRAFGSFNLGNEIKKINGLAEGIKVFTVVVGISTLLAGVIAIGNILLITVKERTKEIGIRRALGATPWVIKRQILFESVVLTVIAGVFGVILGVMVLFLINQQVGEESDLFYNAIVSVGIIGGAFFLMITLGVLIGFLPANRAVKMKPIDALRDE